MDNTMLCVHCHACCNVHASTQIRLAVATHGERTMQWHHEKAAFKGGRPPLMKRPHSRADDPHEVNMLQWCCSQSWPDVLLGALLDAK